jgi:hypothetical protein
MFHEAGWIGQRERPEARGYKCWRLVVSKIPDNTAI